MSTAPAFKVGLTPDEKSLYALLFKALDPENTGIVTGEKARASFEKSGLPPSVLGEIWQLADHNNMGFLSQFGFCYAMRLIGYTQAGHHPSAALAEVPGPLPRFAGMPGAVPSQLTAGSGMQNVEGNVPPISAGAGSPGTVGPVPAADYARYAQMFVKTTGSANTVLDGGAARDIFLKARLPTPVLGQIWSLVDVDNRGVLDIRAFAVAMHLIHGLLSGAVKTLPPILSDSVWQSVAGQDNTRPSVDRMATSVGFGNDRMVSGTSTTSIPASISSVSSPVSGGPSGSGPGPATHVPGIARSGSIGSARGSAPAAPPSASEWTVLATQKLQMDTIFDSLDKNHTGTLSPDQVASYLMTSRLDQHDLASIWDLADIQNTGMFTKVEFGIALFLVNRRRSGLPLPNVVPESLVTSLREAQPQTQTQNQPQTTQTLTNIEPQQLTLNTLVATLTSLTVLAAPAVAAPAAKSSIHELADIFTPTSPEVKVAKAPTLSDLSYTESKPRMALGSTFKPTLTFGQSLLAHQGSPSLIGDDVTAKTVSLPVVTSPVASVLTPTGPLPSAHDIPEPATSQASSVQAPAVPARTSTISAPVPPPKATPPPRTVDYEALRSVPAPPKRQTTAPANSDLLADKEVSGQLSEATADIANISTQVKSLTSQTSVLHDKKVRADQELARILAVKSDIEAKLKVLRASYTNEVTQVEQVEATLSTAKEETEALRSEASIAEAKLNHVSGELTEKQEAVDELQKTNASLREKLGMLNAEMTELQKQLETRTAEQDHLQKEVNVRHSQVQVAIVRVDDLKTTIADLEASNLKHHLDIQRYQKEAEQAEQERITAQARADALSAHNEKLKQNLSDVKSASKSSILGLGLGAVAGAVGGIASGAAITGSNLFGKTSSASLSAKGVEAGLESPVPQVSGTAATKEAPIYQEQVKETQIEHTPSVPEPVAAQDVLETHSDTLDAPVVSHTEKTVEAPIEKHIPVPSVSATEPTPATEAALPSIEKSVIPAVAAPVVAATPAVEDALKEDLPQEIAEETAPEEPTQVQIPGSLPEFDEPVAQTSHEPTHSVSALVDKVQEKPTEDMTGLDDFNATEHKPTDYLKDMDDRTTRTGSAVTDAFRDETPVTLPDNSEYRFQTAGVVGGMVGMPGVLVGVQRTDSMTSSVQNNASLLVRDDNIDDVSEHETLEEAAAPPDKDDEERISSGVELFEIVNADEARGMDALGNHPLAQSHKAELEEFPPIKELDYDESSSDDDDGTTPERFDDAVDHTPDKASAFDEFGEENFGDLGQAKTEVNDTDANKDLGKEQDFGDFDFNDLAPAKEVSEPVQPAAKEGDDLFGDDFDDLKVAAADGTNEFDQFANDFGAEFDNHFTGEGQAADANDEWEQLFAGFGNANTANAVAAPVSPPAAADGFALETLDTSKNLAIDELVGMGFDRDVVVDALQRENWNLEAATNYLLDNA